jgi:hypothetical protein
MRQGGTSGGGLAGWDDLFFRRAEDLTFGCGAASTGQEGVVARKDVKMRVAASP